MKKRIEGIKRVIKFETAYRENLENFIGNVAEFEDAKNLIEYEFLDQ